MESFSRLSKFLLISMIAGLFIGGLSQLICISIELININEGGLLYLGLLYMASVFIICLGVVKLICDYRKNKEI